MGWGNSSINKKFALHAFGPEFNSPDPKFIKAGTMINSYDSDTI